MLKSTVWMKLLDLNLTGTFLSHVEILGRNGWQRARWWALEQTNEAPEHSIELAAEIAELIHAQRRMRDPTARSLTQDQIEILKGDWTWTHGAELVAGTMEYVTANHRHMRVDTEGVDIWVNVLEESAGHIVSHHRYAASHMTLPIGDGPPRPETLPHGSNADHAGQNTPISQQALILADIMTKTITGHTIGYARTSTSDQIAGLEAQLAELTAIGADKIFQEQVSSVAERAQLDIAMGYVREGDTFVVTKIDRLARSVSGLVAIADELRAKGVTLRVPTPDIDTGTPMGQLLLNLLGSIAQFEREIMLERQREGLTKAKREGRYAGRQKTALRHAAKVKELASKGTKPIKIAEELGISRSSVYRMLADQQAA